MKKHKFTKMIIKIFTKPKRAIQVASQCFVMLFGSVIPDELYLKLLYMINIGYWPNFKNPKTFSEKLNYIKLYDHNPEYTIMADKVKAKSWVASRIGEKYIIPTLGVWDNVEDIDFNSLPNKFVIKCNHNSGTGMCICTDKSTLDINKVRRELKKGLSEDYFSYKREWPYKDIPRKIIAEKYIETFDGVSQDLPDYKFFCFNGEPLFCQVIQNRSTSETIDIYDMDWNLQDFVGLNPGIKNAVERVKRPEQLDLMKNICRVLAKDVSFLRVDLYVVDDKIYFGELTFFPMGGFGIFTPKYWDAKIGAMFDVHKL